MQNLNKVKYNPILQHIGRNSNDETKLYNTKEIWQKSIQTLNLNEALSEKWGKIFDTRYSESQRFYHNMFHIQKLIEEHADYCTRMDTSENANLVILMSIWFHDLIYDPQSKSNEVDSEIEF